MRRGEARGGQVRDYCGELLRLVEGSDVRLPPPLLTEPPGGGVPSAKRQVVLTSLPLDEVKALKSIHGTTVNDVVVAMIKAIKNEMPGATVNDVVGEADFEEDHRYPLGKLSDKRRQDIRFQVHEQWLRQLPS